MKPASSFTHTLTVSLLITGNLIGAGILALPVKTGLAGLVPALVGMLVVGGAMLYSAIVLSREAVERQEESFNYPSLYHHYLGTVGKWIAICTNLLILWGLLTAYLSGATTILTTLFDLAIPAWGVTLIFFAIVTFLNLTRIEWVHRHNALLMVSLWGAFAFIVFMAEGKVQVGQYRFTDWQFLPATVPIIITAFHFHNIIPHVSHSLEWDRARIAKAMLAGVLIGFVMNAVWIQVGIGALPLDGSQVSLYQAFLRDQPATVPLSQIIATPAFMTGALLFALLAIATSYLANGMGLLGFFHDLTANHLGRKSRLLTAALAFGPPLVIALLFQDIFLKALNIVGGFGIVILFGILPSIIGLKHAGTKRGRAFAFAMLLFFLLCLITEFGQETGLLRMRPEVEHWKHQVGKPHE